MSLPNVFQFAVNYLRQNCGMAQEFFQMVKSRISGEFPWRRRPRCNST